MNIMRNLIKEGKSILFITHKLHEIMAVSDRVTVLRKGKCMGTVDVKTTNMDELSMMMVGRKVESIRLDDRKKSDKTILQVKGLSVPNRVRKIEAVKNVSFSVKAGEIVTLAGIEGNGQSELVYAVTGLEKSSAGSIEFNGIDITVKNIRSRSKMGMSHIPEDRHKHGLILDFTLENNLVLQRYWQDEFQKKGLIDREAVRSYSDQLIEKYDIRSGQGSTSVVRSMSGGNQQKAIIAREMEGSPSLIVAVQPTRGLDIGAIEYIHKQLVKQRNDGKAVLLVSLELEEVMDISDRILVMYNGEIVAELDPHKTSPQEMGLYMVGAKRMNFDQKQGEAR
jgi:simple sugar transport system ATP-binding protein